MTITSQYLIKLLPLLIIGLTVVFLTLSIAWSRRHFFNAILSVLGLSSAFFSFWFVRKTEIINVTPLIRIDDCALFYSGLVILASLVTCILSYFWLEENYIDDDKEEFYLLILTVTLGGILLTSTNHLITFSLGVELISIPLFGLIGYTLRRRSSLEASIKYMILSSVASSFLLFGIALLYAQYGDLSFEILSKKSFNNDAFLYKPLLLSGLGLIVVALGFKLSLVPFHLWTPDVYQGSPSPVSILLSTVGKIPIFFIMMRLFLYVPEGSKDALRVTIGVIAFFSIIFGNLMALNQISIKRLLSYSSISHFGYLLVTLISFQNEKIIIEAVSVYLFSYLLSNLGAFGVVSLIPSLNHLNTSSDSSCLYRGLFWRYPVLSIVMTIMMLSLAGMPMTLGFIGKFYILITGLKMWYLTATIVVGSSIGFYYYLRVVVSFYLKVPRNVKDNTYIDRRYKKVGEIMVLILASLTLFFGVYPKPLIHVIQSIISTI